MTSLRAQNTYLESKLRSLESLASDAGKAADEQKKRNEVLVAESMRCRAENQQLRADNEQLQHFKTILMSAANGMATNAHTTHATSMSGAAATQQPSFLAAPLHPPSHAAPSLSTADLEVKSQTAQSSNLAQSVNNPSFFFSPMKRPQESIAITNMNPQPNLPHATPFTRRSPNSAYVHVMPSPLSADALSSPAPVMAQKPQGSGDLLQEINDNLSSRSARRQERTCTQTPAAVGSK